MNYWAKTIVPQSKNASMNNTLIDNSENLKMADTLKKCISNDNCKVIKIATGYWDIPGLHACA